MYCEGVPQIMHSWRWAVAVLLVNTSSCAEAHEVVSQGVASQWTAVACSKNEIRVSSLCGGRFEGIDRLVPVASRWAKNRSRSFSRGADLWRASAAGGEKYLSKTVAWAVRAELFPSSVTTLGPIGGCKCFIPR